MPFRDAGYSQADFILNVQDVVYGVWRAKERGLVNLREFVLDEYALQIRLMVGRVLIGVVADTRNLKE
jgi:cell division cycle 14